MLEAQSIEHPSGPRIVLGHINPDTVQPQLSKAQIKARPHGRCSVPLVPQVLPPDQDRDLSVSPRFLDGHVELADVFVVGVDRQDAVSRVLEGGGPLFFSGLHDLGRVVAQVGRITIGVPPEPTLRHLVVFEPAFQTSDILSLVTYRRAMDC